MATNYQRGRAFEYRTRNKLLDMGAAYVMRAAQSKGTFDLAAFFGWEFVGTPNERFPNVMLVQCKRDGKLSKAEREKCIAVAKACGRAAWLAKAGPKGRGVVFVMLASDPKNDYTMEAK
jgi:hypothetical protein